MRFYGQILPELSAIQLVPGKCFLMIGKRQTLCPSSRKLGGHGHTRLHPVKDQDDHLEHRMYKEKLRELVCSALRREGSAEILLLSTNTSQEATDKVKPNFSERCTMVGQEASQNMEIPIRQEKNVFTRRMVKCWKRLLTEVVELPPLEILKTQLDELSQSSSLSNWS